MDNSPTCTGNTRRRRAGSTNRSGAAGSLLTRLGTAEAEVRAATDRLKRTESDRDKISARLVQMDKDLAALLADKTAAEKGLVQQKQEFSDLEKKWLAAGRRITVLEGQIRDNDLLTETASRRLKDLMAKLSAAEIQTRNLRSQADLVPTLQDQLKDYRQRFTLEEALAKSLEKEIGKRTQDLELRDRDLLQQKRDLEEARRSLGTLEKEVGKRTQDMDLRDRDLLQLKRDLEEARRSIGTLESEKVALRTETARVRTAVENRFAGIALTGKRVVFLVDMSGSMDLVDVKTQAPEKWAGVRQTVTKIMRSLPELEQFQVILFSDKFSFPLGHENAWIPFDKDSTSTVSEALGRIKPEGDTNMYNAFEAAFRFRPLGLDTIYLLSDGLPNQGEGLTAEAARGLKETEQSEILSKYIRRKLQNDWNRPLRNQERVRINAVGFFYESPDVGAFLWALTRENEGSFVGMSKP